MNVWHKIVEKNSLIKSLYRQAFNLTLDDKEGNHLQCGATDSLFKKVKDLVVDGLFMKSVRLKQIRKKKIEI